MRYLMERATYFVCAIFKSSHYVEKSACLNAFYVKPTLTRKICGTLSKKLQKLALLKLLSNLSVKTTVFCYFFDIPQILQV